MMRWLAVFMLMLAGPAVAEVCDKERPHWDRSGGTVSLWTEPLWMFSNPVMLALLLFSILGLWSRWRLINVPIGTLIALLGVFVLVDWLGLDDVWAAAIREGCVAPPYLSILLLAAISAANIRAAILGPRAKE